MNAVSKKYQPIADPPEPGKKPRRPILLFFLMLTILGFYAHWQGVDFLVLDADGNVQISPQRQKEMDERLKRIRQAQQYVLRAGRDGYYPCYNCGQDSLIFCSKEKYGNMALPTTANDTAEHGSKGWTWFILLNLEAQ